jgi:hypothetical protein
MLNFLKNHAQSFARKQLLPIIATNFVLKNVNLKLLLFINLR